MHVKHTASGAFFIRAAPLDPVEILVLLSNVCPPLQIFCTVLSTDYLFGRCLSVWHFQVIACYWL